ncbi:MAG: OmpA family protein [Erythrobacter sp.]|jgi:OOP family OmpA-OmpF porin|nr:OmpA family protein [Erythrobacter sp.]
MTIMKYLAPLALAVSLAACQDRTEDAEDPQPATTKELAADPDAEDDPAPVSILRPGIAPPELPEVPLEPLEVVIGFPESSMELDADAVAVLEGVLDSEQVATGAPIVLRSHTDSEGSDKGNMRASEKRGALVKEWLVGEGIAPERIRVIAFGEQNPIAPNALPDGSPNPQGRARNRRVEVAVVPVPEETVPNTPADAPGARGAEAD